MRLLKILAIILIAIVAAAYAVSYFYDKYGSFTVKISKYDMINQGLTLSETPDYNTSNSRLNADILYDMTNISGEDLPDNIDKINGSHNGEGYIAYTFYLINSGKDTLSYDSEMTIENVTNGVDEADSTAADNVALMRRQGFHFLLTGFGTEGFKMLKTAEFKVDNIMLDGSVAQVLGKSDRYDTCVNSLLNFVFDLNAEVIADGITDDKQVKQLSGMQCLYYSGENAGKYIAERYVRNRNE